MSSETYPLSPVQQGMLYHALLALLSGTGVEQAFPDLPAASLPRISLECLPAFPSRAEWMARKPLPQLINGKMDISAPVLPAPLRLPAASRHLPPRRELERQHCRRSEKEENP